VNRLNIGSGQRPFGKPWINIDKQARWNPDIVWDASSILDCPIEKESCDMIVLHHVLEHFGCGEAHRLLDNCYDLLCPTGSLLVFVPDLWELASMWKEGRISDQVYFTNLYGAYMGDEADRHKWGFSRESLRTTIYDSGFKVTGFYVQRELPGADIASDRWILSMEAWK